MEAVLRICLLSLSLCCMTCLSENSLAGQAELQLPPGFQAKLLFEETQQPYFFNGYAMGLQPDEIYVALARRILRLRSGPPS